MRYTYPAVFTAEENGGYSVVFPDLEGCYTCGEDITDAMFMAEDALALVLYGYEHDNRTIPSPSNADDIQEEDGTFVNYISCDTLAYRKMYCNKAVKKTLSIPEWLNEEATALNINFSQVLQEALIQKVKHII